MNNWLFEIILTRLCHQEVCLFSGVYLVASMSMNVFPSEM